MTLMSLVADEGIWQRRLLSEIGIFGNTDLIGTNGRLPPTPLLSDNKASTFTANTPSTGVRSKHIDVRFLKVREYVASGDLRVVHVRTDYNVSDLRRVKGVPANPKRHQMRPVLIGPCCTLVSMKGLRFQLFSTLHTLYTRSGTRSRVAHRAPRTRSHRRQ